jgi:arsenate reductase
VGLTESDISTSEQIIDVLTKHKMLLQRPIVVTSGTAIIGRPKERVRELLASLD